MEESNPKIKEFEVFRVYNHNLLDIPKIKIKLPEDIFKDQSCAERYIKGISTILSEDKEEITTYVFNHFYKVFKNLLEELREKIEKVKEYDNILKNTKSIIFKNLICIRVRNIKDSLDNDINYFYSSLEDTSYNKLPLDIFNKLIEKLESENFEILNRIHKEYKSFFKFKWETKNQKDEG